jgi:hypothetical protein
MAAKGNGNYPNPNAYPNYGHLVSPTLTLSLTLSLKLFLTLSLNPHPHPNPNIITVVLAGAAEDFIGIPNSNPNLILKTIPNVVLILNPNPNP